MLFRTALLTLLTGTLLAGCGGGGVAVGAIAESNLGNSSTSSPPPAGNGVGTVATTAAMKLQMVDAAGSALADPTLSQTADRFIKVTAPNLAPSKRVTVKLDNGLAVLTPQSGSLLTNASGVALLPIAPASVSSNGAVRVTATVAADGGDVSASLDLQAIPGAVALGAVAVSTSTVQIGQSVVVSVDATVDGVAARANSLGVSFSTTCGTVEPATAAVDSTGRASAVIQTRTNGACAVSAATAGVSAQRTAAYTVTNVPAFGLNFVKADPQVIYLKDSIGTRMSRVTFKVVDAGGSAIAGQKVNATFPSTTAVDFCGARTSSAISDSTGEVVFPVCSGSQPTTVQVRAELDGSTIGTGSNLLTVQSGVPSQRFFDIAVDKQNFHVGGYFTNKYSGLSVTITAFAADRQGNPVPNGTPVVFVAEGGQINSGRQTSQSSCLISGGSCSVNLIGQDYRPMGSSVAGADPRPGRVTVLATADGEEHFVDANDNNRYDPGEAFEDLGRPFLDKDEDGVFLSSYTSLVTGMGDGDSSYPMVSGAEGTASCSAGGPNAGLSVAGTCNGGWNGSGVKPDGTPYVPTKVRRRIVVVFSGGEIGLPNDQKPGTCTHTALPGSYNATIPESTRTELLSCSNTGVVVRLADLNGNPLPADAGLSLAVRKARTDGGCTATFTDGATVIGSSTEPTRHGITLTTCVAGDTVDVTVRTADRTRSSTFSVVVP